MREDLARVRDGSSLGRNDFHFSQIHFIIANSARFRPPFAALRLPAV